VVEKVAFEKLFKVSTFDWGCIEGMHWLLGLFEPLTLATESDTEPTIGLVVPLFNSLLDHLQHISEWDPKVDKCKIVIPTPGVPKDIVDCNVKLTALKLDVVATIKKAAQAAYDKIKAYYDKSDDFYTIATILDPRFKLQFYQSDTSDQAESSANIQKK
jgi:hypothetical protein